MTEQQNIPEPESLDEDVYEGPPDSLDRGDGDKQDDEAEEN